MSRSTKLPVTDIVRLRDAALQALNAANKVHDELGVDGEKPVGLNRFGDMSLAVDVEVERVILDVLRTHALPFEAVTEEHGVVTNGTEPRYLVILDGLDGSDLYIQQRGVGRYGTMLGIYANTDPLYGEYVFGGIMEHVRRRLYSASRQGGSWVANYGSYSSEPKPIECSSATILRPYKTRLHADLYYDVLHGTDVLTSRVRGLERYIVTCMQSSAIHYADLARGTVDGVVECTRKQNLEIAAAFPLVSEAGGVMIGSKGENLALLKYSGFGQRAGTPETVISASSYRLASAMRKVLDAAT